MIEPVALSVFAVRVTQKLLRMPFGVAVPLTRYGQPFAEIVRLSPFAAQNPRAIDDAPTVTIVDFRNRPQDQTERLLEGGAFVLTRNDRKVALVRGVKS